MTLPLLLACTPENEIRMKEDDPGEPGDTAVDPPVDTDTGEPPDSGTPPPPSAPVATIVSPDAGEAVESCDGLVLAGEVGDADTPTDQLVVTWSSGGTVLWTGLPEADGTTTLAWDPGDGEWDVTLEVSDPGGLTGSATRAFSLGAPSATPTFTWARSPMADRVAASSVGTCIAAAIALPTDPSWVWDSGDYTPTSSAEDGWASGRTWASWDQVNAVDCHLIELTVEVPDCGEYGALRIASPWYSGMPINDNLYVVVDGSVVYTSGTSYGAGHGGPAETDTWMAEGVEIPLVSLSPGTNTVQLVVEEIASWGGLGYLEPTLVQ
ncbi:MAG: hypothetical protein ACOZNI_14720 [Myxococcota bacterium]